MINWNYITVCEQCSSTSQNTNLWNWPWHWNSKLLQSFQLLAQAGYISNKCKFAWTEGGFKNNGERRIILALFVFIRNWKIMILSTESSTIITHSSSSKKRHFAANLADKSNLNDSDPTFYDLYYISIRTKKLFHFDLNILTQRMYFSLQLVVINHYKCVQS